MSTQKTYLLVDIIVHNSLVLVQQSFLGSIPEIWQNEVPVCLGQDGHSFGWQTVCSMLYVDCSNGHAIFIVKLSNDMKMVIAAPDMQTCYPSTQQSKYSNCIVNPLKYFEEYHKIPFHHHCQVCLIHYFDQHQIPYSVKL